MVGVKCVTFNPHMGLGHMGMAQAWVAPSFYWWKQWRDDIARGVRRDPPTWPCPQCLKSSFVYYKKRLVFRCDKCGVFEYQP